MSESAEPAPGVPHSRIEDILRAHRRLHIADAGPCASEAAGLVTGGSQASRCWFSYVVPLPPGLLFTIINIPFFLFAYRAMGAGFMWKTVAVNAGIAAFSVAMNLGLNIAHNRTALRGRGGGGHRQSAWAYSRSPAMARASGGTGVVTLWLFKRLRHQCRPQSESAATS